MSSTDQLKAAWMRVKPHVFGVPTNEVKPWADAFDIVVEVARRAQPAIGSGGTKVGVSAEVVRQLEERVAALEQHRDEGKGKH